MWSVGILSGWSFALVWWLVGCFVVWLVGWSVGVVGYFAGCLVLLLVDGWLVW